ncbi:uncharacterized protein [Rutidosis leptorrhynchoides]|uniref:uncharacterized protein n=1 Tax=Rutidosis leptorrhynchoides TaxID=125765 RepID=UPI003A991EE2
MGKRTSPVLMINDGGSKGNNTSKPKAAKRKGPAHQGKGKGKMATPTKNKNKKQKVTGQANPKEDPCFGCGEMGHWKRNCPVYLKELKEKRDAGQSSGVQRK